MYMIVVIILLLQISLSLSSMLLTNTGNLIVSSRKSGAVVSSFVDSDKITLDDGYAIQRCIMNDPMQPFGKLIGWKMGATNEQAMTALGINHINQSHQSHQSHQSITSINQSTNHVNHINYIDHSITNNNY